MTQALIFDIDGTLVDSDQAMIGSIQLALKQELGLDLSFTDLAFTKGIPTQVSLQHFIDDPAEIDRVEEVVNHFIGKLVHTEKLFPGVASTLRQLAPDIQLGIVTSKTSEEFNNEFVPMGLMPLFDTVITASDTDRHKPHPAPLELALSRLGITATEAIYVGDTKYDLEMTHAAGAQFALARWGTAGTTTWQQEADIVLAQPTDIAHLVR